MGHEMIPQSQWKWHGLPGHFICVDKCIFRLHTTVGKYKISTVGAMYININGKRILDSVGHKRHYETFVFDLTSEQPYCEIDSESIYLGKEKSSSEDWDAKAEKMHIDMCFKYAEIGGHEMTQTPRQREEWEKKRSLALENINSKIELIEHNLECMIKERDRIEEMTFEDSYFEFVSEQGIDK